MTFYFYFGMPSAEKDCTWLRHWTKLPEGFLYNILRPTSCTFFLIDGFRKSVPNRWLLTITNSHVSYRNLIRFKLCLALKNQRNFLHWDSLFKMGKQMFKKNYIWERCSSRVCRFRTTSFAFGFCCFGSNFKTNNKMNLLRGQKSENT